MTQAMETDEFLAHYGVKGMRWGHRKSAPGAGAGGMTRHQRNEIRNRVNAQQLRSNVASTKAALTVGKNRKAKKEAAHKQRLEYLRNPDRVTAATMTRGEKLFYAAFTSATASPLAATTGILATNAYANRVEYKQKHGMYK